MRVLIVGSGYVGKAFARRALASGYEAVGVKRDITTLRDLPGLVPFRADLAEPGTLAGLPAADAVICCQAPSREDDSYRSVYFEGTRNLLQALKKRPSKFIFISSTSVYADAQGRWVDEQSPVGEDDDTLALLGAEKLTLESGLPAIILRLAGIYGPGRNRLRALREGKIKPVFSEVVTNRIHLEDIVSALMVLLMNGEPGEVYNGCDDRPCTQKEFYEWLCPKLGGPLMKHEPDPSAPPTGKRCSNAKLKTLGWSPAFPSYIEGYSAILRETKN